MSVINTIKTGGVGGGDSGGSSSIFGKYRINLMTIRRPSLISGGTSTVSFGASSTGFKRYLSAVELYADNNVILAIEGYNAYDETGKLHITDGDWVPLFRGATGPSGVRFEFLTMFGALQDITGGLNNVIIKNYSAIEATNAVGAFYFVEIPI